MPLLTIPIATGTDDAREIAGSVSTNSVASGDIDSNLKFLGLRFVVPTITQGETIINASLDVYISSATSDEPNLDIFGQASDAPLTFSTAANNISARTKTTATVHFGTGAPLGLATLDKLTITGLGPIIQELVNRPGRVAGGAMVLLLQGPAGTDGTHDFSVTMHEYTGPTSTDAPGTWASVLNIQYGTPAGHSAYMYALQ